MPFRSDHHNKLNFQEIRRIKAVDRLRNKRNTIAPTLFLEDLICGSAVVSGPYIDKDYIGLVNRLRSDLADIHPHIQLAVSPGAALPASAVFPFLARKFLELSLTALLTRIDPLRVIAARKNQLDPSYESGRQNAAAVAWTGDIFSKEKPPSRAWDSQVLGKGLERSLLGWHISAVAIADGLSWLTDVENSSSDWLRELSAQEKPFDWIRGRLTQLYSSLSKGIHAEYLLDDRTAFDDSSIQQHMRDCYMLILLLATATHISPLFLRSIPHESALAAFRKLEKTIFSN